MYSCLSTWWWSLGTETCSSVLRWNINKPRNHCCCGDGKFTSLIHRNTRQDAHHEDIVHIICFSSYLYVISVTHSSNNSVFIDVCCLECSHTCINLKAPCLDGRRGVPITEVWNIFARSNTLWVPIPLKVWMFRVCMRLFWICVVLCR
jgi:hypothetical protein